MLKRLMLALALAGALAAGACENLVVRGEGGSSSEPEIDIGVKF